MFWPWFYRSKHIYTVLLEPKAGLSLKLRTLSVIILKQLEEASLEPWCLYAFENQVKKNANLE